MDIWTKEKRSKVMSKIRSKDTKPELLLRSALHRRGYRFRIHRKDLPGKPDIVLPKFKTVIFVHGCFWHLHQDCIDGRIPKTQSEKWRKKLEGNVERDKLHEKKLIEMGWHVLTIWECEVEKEIDSVLERIDSQLKHQGQE
ncbi:MAG: DNA mismatch endonuclease Vsr [bacterium]|nr:DNA mismatch endonuclease Vsr [bacterium]